MRNLSSIFYNLTTDKLLSLLAALSSTNPDSTISVRSAYENSRKQQDTPQGNKNFLSFIKNCSLVDYNNCGFTDLKNCVFYYAGNFSAINYGHNLGDFNDISNFCNNYLNGTAYFTYPIEFKSDEQLSIFLSLYKSGNL